MQQQKKPDLPATNMSMCKEVSDKGMNAIRSPIDSMHATNR